jgi:hypothetical protein
MRSLLVIACFVLTACSSVERDLHRPSPTGNCAIDERRNLHLSDTNPCLPRTVDPAIEPAELIDATQLDVADESPAWAPADSFDSLPWWARPIVWAQPRENDSSFAPARVPGQLAIANGILALALLVGYPGHGSVGTFPRD